MKKEVMGVWLISAVLLFILASSLVLAASCTNLPKTPEASGDCSKFIDEDYGTCTGVNERTFCNDYPRGGLRYHVTCLNSSDTSCSWYDPSELTCPRITKSHFVNKWGWYETDGYLRTEDILKIAETYKLGYFGVNIAHWKSIDFKQLKAKNIITLVYTPGGALDDDWLDKWASYEYFDGLLINIEAHIWDDPVKGPIMKKEMSAFKNNNKIVVAAFHPTLIPRIAEFEPYVDIYLPWWYSSNAMFKANVDSLKSKTSKPVYPLGGHGDTEPSGAMEPSEAAQAPALFKRAGYSDFALYAGYGFWKCALGKCDGPIGVAYPEHRQDYLNLLNALKNNYGSDGVACQKTSANIFCTESDWSCSDWSSCSNNQQTKTCTKINAGCVNGIQHQTTEVQSCTSSSTPNKNLPSCTYNYSNWSNCSVANVQTRTLVSSSPAECSGTPELNQTCTYTAALPGCTEADWGVEITPDECPANGKQIYSWVKINNCNGGIFHNDSIEVPCSSPKVVCNSFSYSNWENCSSNNIRTRTVVASFPPGCEGGSPILSENCNFIRDTNIQNAGNNSSNKPSIKVSFFKKFKCRIFNLFNNEGYRSCLNS